MRGLDDGLHSAKQTLEWARRAMVEQFEVLLPATAGADALVTMIDELGAPTVAEHRGIPHFRVCCMPVLPGAQPPPLLPVQRVPAPLIRPLWAGVDLATALIFGRDLNAARARLGLPKVTRFSAYAAGSSHNLLAYDPVLSPPVRDTIYRHEYVGYPFGGDEGPLPVEVEAFLHAGPRPVYVGFGSVCPPEPAKLTRVILGAAERAGCRLILDCGWAGLGKDLERCRPACSLSARFRIAHCSRRSRPRSPRRERHHAQRGAGRRPAGRRTLDARPVLLGTARRTTSVSRRSRSRCARSRSITSPPRFAGR